MISRLRGLCFFLLIMLACVGAWAEDDYSLLDTRTYDVVNRYEIRNTSNYQVTDVKVKVCIGTNTEVKATDPPAVNDSLYQRKIRYRMSPRPSTMTTDALGNTFGEFSVGRLDPGAKVSITIEKFVKNSGFKLSKGAYAKTGSFDEFLATKFNQQFVKPSAHIESDAEAIKNAAAPYAALTDKPISERVWLLYQAINTYLSYDENPQYAHKGALNALNTRRGVCTEFSGLFVAFCRAMGIPARVVNGYWVRKRDLALNNAVDVHGDRHAWPEYYLPTVGWIPAEPTMICTMNGTRVPNADYFASIPLTDRHFIWGYGLEVESMTGVSFSYRVMRLEGDNDEGGDPLQGQIAEESVKQVADDDLPPQAK